MDERRRGSGRRKIKAFLGRIKRSFGDAMGKRKWDKDALICDLAIFSTGFLLSRCHLLFSVRPIGLAFVCALPTGVWPALFGSMIGYLSLGSVGLFFGVALAVAIFLRVAFGFSDKPTLFREALSIRTSIATVSGFAAAVFEILRSGLKESSLLFGLSMIILPPILTFIFSGLFTDRISVEALLQGDRNVFSLKDTDRQEKYDVIFFQISALMLLFFIGLSFRGVDILGVSLSYLFSASVTLLTAKRFGAMRGLAVGFASSLGISGVLSVSFALAGLVSGGLFGLGTGYALVGGGAALCAFSAYSSGMMGLLSTMPEYLISAALTFPLLSRIRETKAEESEVECGNPAEDMVGTMALAYQNGYAGSLGRLEEALLQLSSVIKGYRSLEERADRGDFFVGVAKEYELMAKLISDSKEADRSEITVDNEVTPTLDKIMEESGLLGTARVFGKRKKHLILACEDPDGSKITASALKRNIEEGLGVRLSNAEYFRKDKMALMECTAKRRLSVRVGLAQAAGHTSEPSGDSVAYFETKGDLHYTLISDGMGSGEVAKRTSLFVCDFLKSALEIGAAKETLIHLLNRALRSRVEECSATVDLFEMDLISGEGKFIKCGAAPSFVKRGSSIFRIRSQTAPIGLLSSVDAEKIKVDIRPDDYIIMLSDGIADETEDAPWLLLLLGEAPPSNTQDYANLILDRARRHSGTRDDMTVAVIKIEEL